MNDYQEAEKLYQKANICIENENFEKALECLELALKMNPLFAEAISKLVFVHYKLNFRRLSKNKVFEMAEKAINLNDKSPITWKHMGDAHSFIEQYNKAIDCYDKALQLDKNYDSALLNKAISHFHLKDFNKAIKYLEKVKEVKPYQKLIYLYKGHIYHENKEYDLAIDNYLEVLKFDPNSIPALINLGHVFYNQGDFQKALKYYIKANNIKTYDIEITMSLGRIYYRLNELDKALECFIIINEKDENNIKVLIYLGNIYHNKHNYMKAINYYLKGFEINNQNVEILNNIGKSYNELKDFDKAIYYLENAIKLEKEFKNGWINLGIAYGNKKNYEKSIECCKKAIELDIKDPFPFNNLGNLFFEMNQFEEAIKYYNKAIELDENYLIPFFNLGNLYHRNEEYNKSIQCYQKALELDNYYIFALNNLGNSFQEIGDFENAILSYSKIIEEKTNFFPALYNLGNLYLKRKEFKRALEYYSKAKEINHKFKDLWLNISNTYFFLKDYNKAINCLEEFITIDNQYPSIFINLTGFLFLEKRYDDVIKYCNRALDFFPNNDSILLNKALALYKLNRISDSLKVLIHLLRLNPEIINAYELRGIIFLKQNQYYKATENFESAKKLYFIKKKFKDFKYNQLETYETFCRQNYEIDNNLDQLNHLIDTSLRSKRLNTFKEKWLSVQKNFNYFYKSINFENLNEKCLALLKIEQYLITEISDIFQLNDFKRVTKNEIEDIANKIEDIRIISGIEFLNGNRNFIQKYCNLAKSEPPIEKIILNTIKSMNYVFNHILIQLGKELKKPLKNLLGFDIEPFILTKSPKSIKLEHEPEIKIIEIEDFKNLGIKICLVQLDFDIIKKFPPKIKDKEIEKIKLKIKKALDLAKSQKVDIICFPELSFNRKILEIAMDIKDLFIICGSFYDEYNYNCCYVIYNDLKYKINKISPCPYEESDLIYGKKMNQGNEILIFITKDKRLKFSILICLDYYNESWKILNYKFEVTDTLDFIFNPSFDDSIDKFQRCADGDCEKHITDIIKVSNANPNGGSYVFGREHKRGIERLKCENVRKDDHFKYKLCEILGEGMLIFDIVRKPIEAPTPLKATHRIQEIQFFTLKDDNWERIDHF